MNDTIDGLAVRAITADEYDDFATAVEAAFGTQARPEDVARWRAITELDRTQAVFDGGRIVATGTADSLELTVPGGAAVPMAGITAIGVLPTHRRRGLLTGVMHRLLADAHDRGEPLAGLWASEAGIYGRFGFGWASTGLHVQVDAIRASFAQPVELRGQTRLLGADEQAVRLPALYERARSTVAGMLSCSPGRWGWLLHDPEHLRDGASERFAVAYADRGYARYRIREHEDEGRPRFTLLVEDLVALDEIALAGLWRYLLDVDLVATVRAEHRPVDDPLRLLLVDPREAVASTTDALWLRLLDVPAALTARAYAAPGDLVLEVADGVCPWVAGTYLLDVRDGHARCAATGAPPHLSMRAGDLAALYLGGVRPSQLARAGRVVEHDAGAIERADSLFTTARVPWCPFVF